MKTVASASPGDIAILRELLKMENIPCESRIVDEASGLETTDLLVQEEDYDRACDLIENWQDADFKRKVQRRCPKCGGQDWEAVEDPHYQRVGLVVYRCRSCGSLVPM